MLIIPSIDEIGIAEELSEQYGAGFEYNDFFRPAILDDPLELESRIKFYKNRNRDRSKDTMHGAFLDVTIHSEDSKIRAISEERVRKSMEVAAALGVKGVVFHTNIMPQLKLPAYINNWIDTSEAFWTKLLTEYQGIEVYLENMFDESPEPMKRLFQRMENVKGFGICMDYAHATLFGSNISDWVEALGPYIRHLHINDNDLVSDLHLAVGDGKIDWETYNHLMREVCTVSNNTPSVLIEVTGMEKVKRSIDYMIQNSLFWGTHLL